MFINTRTFLSIHYDFSADYDECIEVYNRLTNIHSILNDKDVHKFVINFHLHICTLLSTNLSVEDRPDLNLFSTNHNFLTLLRQENAKKLIISYWTKRLVLSSPRFLFSPEDELDLFPYAYASRNNSIVVSESASKLVHLSNIEKTIRTTYHYLQFRGEYVPVPEIYMLPPTHRDQYIPIGEPSDEDLITKVIGFLYNV